MLVDDQPYDETLSDDEEAEEIDAGSKEYRIRNVLRVPRATTYTAEALYKSIFEGDINLQPEYQRDVVWSTEKQCKLIDSILRNYYIPPIIFAVTITEDGTETKTCIDGKQRLTSIYRFMEGLNPFIDPYTKEKLWYTSNSKATTTSSKAKQILPLQYRKQFASKQVVCVEYTELSDTAERDIFQRVQLGMALTPAERLQSCSSPRADFIRDLCNEFLADGRPLVSDNISWNMARAVPFNCFASTLYLLENRGKATVDNASLDKYLSDKKAKVSPEMQSMMRNAYQTFSQLVVTHAYAVQGNIGAKGNTGKKVAPVEMTAIPVMLSRWKEEMPDISLKQLAHSVQELRKHVRERHTDIRGNTAVAKTIMEFIDAGITGNGLYKKRKIEENQEEEDPESDEEMPAPKRTRLTPSKSMGTVRLMKDERKQVEGQKIKTEAKASGLPSPTPSSYR